MQDSLSYFCDLPGADLLEGKGVDVYTNVTNIA